MKITRKQLRTIIRKSLLEARDSADTGVFGDDPRDWPFSKRWLRYSGAYAYLHPNDAMTLEVLFYETTIDRELGKFGVGGLKPAAAKKRFMGFGAKALLKSLAGVAQSQISVSPVKFPKGHEHSDKIPLPPKWSIGMQTLFEKARRARALIEKGRQIEAASGRESNHYDQAVQLLGSTSLGDAIDTLNAVYYFENELRDGFPLGKHSYAINPKDKKSIV